jgi:hypothetical protein
MQLNMTESVTVLLAMRAVYGKNEEWKIRLLQPVQALDNTDTFIVLGGDPYKAVREWIERQPAVLNGSVLAFEEVKL